MDADLKRRVSSLRHSPSALSRLRFHVLAVNIWLDEDRPDDDDNRGILIPSEIGVVEFTVEVHYLLRLMRPAGKGRGE